MRLLLNNLISNKNISRIINLNIVSALNLFYVILLFWLSAYLFSLGVSGKYFLFFIIAVIFSTLPIANFLFNKIHNYVQFPAYQDLYFKIMDSILGITSFDEILYKTFYSVIKFTRAGFGYIIYYNNETDVIEIKYGTDERHKVQYRDRTGYDEIILKHIKGHDILIKNAGSGQSFEDRELKNVFEQLNADIIAPIYYNKKVFGIIIIGQKTGYSEREIKLLKMIAYKLARLSVNSYYFTEIRKGKEVEKEYELVNRIQKQFLPEPSLESGRVKIKVFHKAVSSLTREFYDIFVNEMQQDDIRISAYRVIGDVKEISILMPGIQAMLQSYARLGFSPRKTMSRLKSIVKERNLLSGELMLFHSAIRQSGEFICCCSNYPAPFYYKNSEKKFVQIADEDQTSLYIKIMLEPGDLIITACGYYSAIINEKKYKYSEMIRKNQGISLAGLRDILMQKLEIEATGGSSTGAVTEDEDKLLIFISAAGEN